MSGSKRDIVSKVVDFFYEDEEFASYFETWCKKRANRIDTGMEENKLEYTSLYKDYLREVEDKLTEFIDKNGSSIEEFYDLLKERELDSKEDVFVQILNATTDFDVFIQMMREAAEEAAEESKC